MRDFPKEEKMPKDRNAGLPKKKRSKLFWFILLLIIVLAYLFIKGILTPDKIKALIAQYA